MEISFLLLLSFLDQAYPQKIYGVAFGRHGVNALYSSAADQSLRNAKAPGVNYLHVTAYAQTTNRYTSNIYKIHDMKPIAYLITKVHNLGLKILFQTG